MFRGGGEHGWGGSSRSVARPGRGGTYTRAGVEVAWRVKRRGLLRDGTRDEGGA